MGMTKLKIGGAWSGVLDIDVEEWTVAMLREEVAKRCGCIGGPQAINLISAGKVLKDGDGTEKLSQFGFKNNSKILATRISVDQGKQFLAEEERSKRLARLKFAATSLAQRHSGHGALPVENFNLELENQSGQKVQLGSESDQRAIMMGLVLHTNAKQLIAREQYRDALEVLNMGEEVFSLCNPKAIEMVDNVSILQIDMVWCYFMLRDISWLAVAGQRLAKAREGIERAHGKGSIRLRLLQGGQCPELALYLRLELLEGIVAYHSGHFDNSKQALSSAQFKFFQLQVSDEALSLLMGMGYKEKAAKRALRMNNQDVERAVDFLVEERKSKIKKLEEDIMHIMEILEQRSYGMTPLGKGVDLQKLNELVSFGFEREVAAEALRRNENDTHKSLDDLISQETIATLQIDIANRKNETLDDQSTGEPNGSSEATMGIGNYGLVADSNETNATMGVGNHDLVADNQKKNVVKRDVEMEDELTSGLERKDVFSDYDIDVSKEGEAIKEYLNLLSSTK
ncbi:hypothetical protein ACH5RR_030646 [Cinchona calisaya]|uniref:UBA domain-containing protein n=1 Tax=Cinchona calisaya TaxID=153742 RepID=A0ABD2YYQ3_9GENT